MVRGCLLTLVCLALPRVLASAPLAGGAVATVGDEAITRDDVRQAAQRISLRYRERPVDEVLQTLIDRKIMVLEAQAKGLDQLPQTASALEAARRQRLTEELYRAEVSEKVVVSETDIADYYHQNRLDRKREIRASHIEVETRETALEVRQLLEAGDDFAALAQRFSVDAATADKGGDLGYWQEEDTLKSPFVRQLFALEPGAISEPYLDPRGRFHIIHSAEARPLGLERQREHIESVLTRLAKDRLWRGYQDEQAARVGLTIEPAALGLLLRLGRTAVHDLPPVASQDAGRVLCRFEGGALSLGDYYRELAEAPRSRRPAAVDSAAVSLAIREIALVTRILPACAERWGLDEEELRHAMAGAREEVLTEALRRSEVEDKVLSRERLRAYYDENQDKLMEPARTLAEGGIVASLQEAQAIAARIRHGEELSVIMQSYPLLHGRWRKYDAFNFATADTARRSGPLGPMMAVARTMEIGEIRDPIQVRFGQNQEGFVVLRVMERRPARKLPFDQIEERIRRALVHQHVKELEAAFAEYMHGLRRKYAQQIAIDPQALAETAAP